MSIQDPYLVNVDLETHLRDARHAHRLFTEHGFALAPKNKFLYHIVFQIRPEVGDQTTSNTAKFQKEIGVLAKACDLPKFRASIENKQQYNRKKNVQTRIDYEDINITFHDDNNGLTRAMLEEYYKYYFRDGRTDPNSGAYDPRDKFYSRVPKYGLDNQKVGPFFAYIKIYQLARRNWFSYTLINPIISGWGHDSVDASDGAGIMENNITVAYESVVYNHGAISDGGEPLGFTDEETRYDKVPSPLGYWSEELSYLYTTEPTLLDPKNNNPYGVLGRMFNNAGLGGVTGLVNQVVGIGGALASIIVPTHDSQNNSITSTIKSFVGKVTDSDGLLAGLTSSPEANKSFLARSLNSGAIDGLNYSSYNSLDANSKALVQNDLKSAIQNGDKKIQGFAQEAIDKTYGSSIT